MLVPRDGITPGVLIRDFLIFYIKLFLDGLKDVVLLQVSLVAFVADLALMLFTKRRKARFFYGVLEIGERWDLWLNLHGATRDVGKTPDGLFGASRAGTDTLLGEIEELVRRGPEPAPRPGVPRPGH